jgi:mannose-6-phosphate isomerase-like protein (cupin superfamily)
MAMSPDGKEYRAAHDSPYGETVIKKKGQMEILDVQEVVDATKEKWMNCTLSHVNDSLIRMGIFEGEFHWHHHDREDEFFYVVSGKLLLDLPEGTVELLPLQGFTVPRGVEHRTRAQEKTVVLMVEGNSVNPRGD